MWDVIGSKRVHEFKGREVYFLEGDLCFSKDSKLLAWGDLDHLTVSRADIGRSAADVDRHARTRSEREDRAAGRRHEWHRHGDGPERLSRSGGEMVEPAACH